MTSSSLISGGRPNVFGRLPTWQLIVVQSLIIATAVFLVYGQIVEHPFQDIDDPDYVSDNYYVRNGATIEGVVWAIGSFDAANWHPFTWLSHMLDVELFGPKPAGHYLTNIGLHISESLLLLWFMRLLLRADWPSFLTALIWAVHPANVENVAWIAERKSLLAMVFILYGLILYMKYRKTGMRAYYLAAVVAQLLASMSKPIAVLFPVAMVLVTALDDESSFPAWRMRGAAIGGGAAEIRRMLVAVARRWRELAPCVAIAMLSASLTFWAQDSSGATNYNNPLAWRIGNAFASMEEYTLKSFTMPHSSIMYIIAPLVGWKVAVGIVIVGGFTVLSFLGLRWARMITFGLLWYLLMFLPTIGLVQVGSQRLADRYLGLPLIGLVCVIVWCVFRMAPRLRSELTCILVLIGWAVALGLQARALSVDWSDTLRLAENAERYGGCSSSMRLNLSVANIAKNNLSAAREGLQIIRDEASASLNLAVVDLMSQNYDEATRRLSHLYTNKRTRLSAAILTAIVYDKQGNFSSAVRAYKGAINFMPPRRSYRLSVEQYRAQLPILLAVAQEKAKAKAERGAEQARPVQLETKDRVAGSEE